MDTFVYVFACSMEERFKEIDILIAKAAQEEPHNSDLYDALCRATIVLMVAHLESYIKDVTKSVLNDINKFSSFKDAPVELKRTFCRAYIDAPPDSKELQQKTLKLIDIFDSLETKFTHEPFFYESKYGDNKNPSPDVINKICKNFGISNVFDWIKESKVDDIFSSTESEISNLVIELRMHVFESTINYPYDIDLNKFGLSNAVIDKGKSFYETYLDELLKKRHEVAHGSSLDNSFSVKVLTEHRNKVIILVYTLILIISSASLPKN
jgi:hypothetical protein